SLRGVGPGGLSRPSVRSPSLARPVELAAGPEPVDLKMPLRADAPCARVADVFAQVAVASGPVAVGVPADLGVSGLAGLGPVAFQLVAVGRVGVGHSAPPYWWGVTCWWVGRVRAGRPAASAPAAGARSSRAGRFRLCLRGTRGACWRGRVPG